MRVEPRQRSLERRIEARADGDVLQSRQDAGPLLKGERRSVNLEVKRGRMIPNQHLAAEGERGAAVAGLLETRQAFLRSAF